MTAGIAMPKAGPSYIRRELVAVSLELAPMAITRMTYAGGKGMPGEGRYEQSAHYYLLGLAFRLSMSPRIAISIVVPS